MFALPGCREISQLPDLFIYLTYDDDHISFKRIQTKDFQKYKMDVPESVPIIFEVRPDLAVGKLEDWQIAYIKARIFIGKHGANEDLSVGR